MVVYLSFPDALEIHFDLMQSLGETRYSVFYRELIESALARPQQAAAYESADLIRQAATLCFGLIKNHPWQGGNKRTATAITQDFLLCNGYKTTAQLPSGLSFRLPSNPIVSALTKSKLGIANTQLQ